VNLREKLQQLKKRKAEVEKRLRKTALRDDDYYGYDEYADASPYIFGDAGAQGDEASDIWEYLQDYLDAYEEPLIIKALPPKGAPQLDAVTKEDRIKNRAQEIFSQYCKWMADFPSRGLLPVSVAEGFGAYNAGQTRALMQAQREDEQEEARKNPGEKRISPDSRIYLNARDQVKPRILNW